MANKGEGIKLIVLIVLAQVLLLLYFVRKVPEERTYDIPPETQASVLREAFILQKQLEDAEHTQARDKAILQDKALFGDSSEEPRAIQNDTQPGRKEESEHPVTHMEPEGPQSEEMEAEEAQLAEEIYSPDAEEEKHDGEWQVGEHVPIVLDPAMQPCANPRSFLHDLTVLSAAKPIVDGQGLSQIIAAKHAQLQAECGAGGVGFPVAVLGNRKLHFEPQIERLRATTNHTGLRFVCVFIFDSLSKRDRIAIDIINRTVDFCPQIVMQSEGLRKSYDGLSLPQVYGVARLKTLWWWMNNELFGMDHVIEGGGNPYRDDIIILEDDIMVAEDMAIVARLLSHVRNTYVGEHGGICGLSGWGGENQVNAHPRTFVIEENADPHCPSHGYLYNSTFFEALRQPQNRKSWEKANSDWDNAIGVLFVDWAMPNLLVRPTLSRVWHTGSHNGRFYIPDDQPWTTSPFGWHPFTHQTVHEAVLRWGMHDIFGFYCPEYQHGETHCTKIPHSVFSELKQRYRYACYEDPGITCVDS